ncbi:LLM class flavin-dependent oxidoreductase [Streptomyces sp. NPDC088763]|uniref:LLM class flavin-dependent oxidoreductase n=1 Tax=Streptomyces sp. NPDC088763 TaxID=3365892 RepID=UPI00382C8D26
MAVMDLRIMTEPQFGSDYKTQLTLAKASEDMGFSAFFRSDRFATTAAAAGQGLTDAWTTLAGLARETSAIRLGTMTTAATVRLPGLLAVQVSQVDQMSDGRVELGFGAGSGETEHRAFGFPLPPDVNARWEEQLGMLYALWNLPPGKSLTHRGTYYRWEEFPALPESPQGRVPVIISGLEAPRAFVLAADFAHEYNAPFASVAEAAAQFELVRSVAHYRDDLVYSATVSVCVGRDAAAVAQRAETAGLDIAALRKHGVVGTPGEVVDAIMRYAEIGLSRLYLHVHDMTDLDQLELVASEVRPQLA